MGRQLYLVWVQPLGLLIFTDLLAKTSLVAKVLTYVTHGLLPRHYRGIDRASGPEWPSSQTLVLYALLLRVR